MGLAANSGRQICDPAPDIEIKTPDGVRRLSDLRGQPVVLAFSAEWDPAWTQQLLLYRTIIANSGAGRLLDAKTKGVQCQIDLQGETSVNFAVIGEIPSDGEAAKRFGLGGGQAVIVLDGEGVIQWKHVAQAGNHPTVAMLQGALTSLNRRKGLSRRQFLATAVAASLALAILPTFTRAEEPRSAASGTTKTINLIVNGQIHAVAVEPRVSLLDALRERIGLTGTKKGCDHGQCGACTVHMNGRRVNSCLVLAMQAEGANIATIEGLAHGDSLHPVQEAFIKYDGLQCGYCTPGQVMSAVACIQEGHTGSDDEIKEWMSGNICRCGAYQGICEAIKDAKQRMGGAK